jgi:cation transport protein ChaC
MPSSPNLNELKLTRELVARAHRVVADPGPPADRVPMTEADYERLVEAALSRAAPNEDIWLFAYGSLIWNPACESVEHRPAVVHGWHRSFCLKLVRYRGSAERPGLMMALDRGGLCRGLAYRIAREDAAAALSSVMRREISMKPMANQPRWLTTLINGERRPALGFVINRDISTYVGRLSPEESAHLIATGCGHWGSCAEYLLNTVLKLEEHGIRDRNLWRLQALVAERLAAKDEVVRESHSVRN